MNFFVGGYFLGGGRGGSRTIVEMLFLLFMEKIPICTFGEKYGENFIRVVFLLLG